MHKTNLLLASGIATLMGQIAFAAEINALGIALSAAALPMLLPFASHAMQTRLELCAQRFALNH